METEFKYEKDSDPNFLKGFTNKVVRRKAKKEDADKVIKEIKDLEKEKRVIIGTEETVRSCKLGRVSKVYFSKNVKEEIRKEIKYYAEISGFEVEELEYSSSELGTKLEKPYIISVLSIVKQE